jgi:hypothetical protein
MIMVAEEDVDRLERLLGNIAPLCEALPGSSKEAAELLERLALARRGYPKEEL